MNHNEATQHFTSCFNQFHQNTTEPAWLFELRKSALQKFRAIGLPNRKVEDWRYTSISELLKFAPTPTRLPVESVALKPEILAMLDAFSSRFVFVNGVFSLAHSKFSNQSGIVLKTVAEESAAQPTRLKDAFTNFSSQDAFSELNLAFATAGAYLKVSNETRLNAPLNLVFITTADLPKSSTHLLSRNIIELGAFSETSLIETHISEAQVEFANTPVTTINVDNGARLDYTRLQLENNSSWHIGATNIDIAADAHVNAFSFQSGAKLGRHDLRVKLSGQGAEVILNGLFVANGSQVLDNHTSIDHVKPHTTSKQLYKGILAESSRGVFNGKVFVRKDAQRVDSVQLNKNLLLSDDARIDTKPELEIAADDVKCTHGATSGQLSLDELFYLQSRCLSRDLAYKLLVNGFAEDAMADIRHQPTRKWISTLMSDKLSSLESNQEVK